MTNICPACKATLFEGTKRPNKSPETTVDIYSVTPTKWATEDPNYPGYVTCGNCGHQTDMAINRP